MSTVQHRIGGPASKNRRAKVMISGSVKTEAALVPALPNLMLHVRVRTVVIVLINAIVMFMIVSHSDPGKWRSCTESNGLCNSDARSHRVSSVRRPVILRDGLSHESELCPVLCSLWVFGPLWESMATLNGLVFCQLQA